MEALRKAGAAIVGGVAAIIFVLLILGLVVSGGVFFWALGIIIAILLAVIGVGFMIYEALTDT